MYSLQLLFTIIFALNFSAESLYLNGRWKNNFGSTIDIIIAPQTKGFGLLYGIYCSGNKMVEEVQLQTKRLSNEYMECEFSYPLFGSWGYILNNQNDKLDDLENLFDEDHFFKQSKYPVQNNYTTITISWTVYYKKAKTNIIIDSLLNQLISREQENIINFINSTEYIMSWIGTVNVDKYGKERIFTNCIITPVSSCDESAGLKISKPQIIQDIFVKIE